MKGKDTWMKGKDTLDEGEDTLDEGKRHFMKEKTRRMIHLGVSKAHVVFQKDTSKRALQ